jgi:hypothetical protein
MVLEVVVAAVVLVGVAVVLIATMSPGSESDRSGSQDLEEMARDTLRVLAVDHGDTSRRSSLATMVADALHDRPDELRNRTTRILASGAGSSLHLSNGHDEQPLVEGDPAPNGSVHARQPFAPTWATLHVVPQLRIYPSDAEADMNVTALPLWAGNPLEESELEVSNVTFPDGFDAPLEDDGPAPGTLANASIPNASTGGGNGYPTDDEVVISSNTTNRDELLEGEATYRTDDADVVETTYDPVRDNMSDVSLDASPGDLDVGDNVTVSWDLSPISDALEDHTDTAVDPEVHLSLIRPIPRKDPALPPHRDAADYASLAVEGSLEVPVDDHAVVGRWAVVAQLNATLATDSGDLNQSVRTVETFVVRTPGTTGDPRGLYGLEMVAWYEDW